MRRALGPPRTVASILGRLRGHSGTAERRAKKQLIRIGPRAIPELIRLAATHGNAFARAVAVAALAAYGSRGRRAILRALDDPAMPVRLAALVALDQTWYRGAAKAGVRLLDDPSGSLRVNAAVVLGRHKVTEAWKPLTGLLGDEKWYVRQGAAGALGMLEVPSARRALVRTLNDPRPAVRRAAREALTRIDRR